jgi:uncharacterized protein YndB with AHSA1/START domain
MNAPARTAADGTKDFQLERVYPAPVSRLYDQFATEAGIRNWWTIFCSMDERLGGRAAFRFPSSDFYAIAEIVRLEPGRCVEWRVVDAQHPASAGFADPRDWVGTSIRFEVGALDPNRSRLAFTHVGLAPLECAGVCVKGWTFYLDHSLRRYFETGRGDPHTKE